MHRLNNQNFKIAIIPNVGEGVEKLRLPSIAGGNVNGAVALKTVEQSLPVLSVR